MLIVPKVTMIGANFILLISIPLRNPSKVPTIAPVNRDNIGLTPEVDNLAIVSAVIPKIEPAETSIPPVIIIIVIPIALIAILATCINMFFMLSICKNELAYRLMKNDNIIIVKKIMISRLFINLLIFNTNTSPHS